MGRRGSLGAVGAAVAVLGVALTTSSAAYADDTPSLYPPGSVGVPGPPRDVIDFGSPPWFSYTQQTTSFNVVDADQDVVGHFDDTKSAVQMFLGAELNDVREVLSDGTGAAAAATGSVHDQFGLVSFLGLGYFTFLGNDYLSTPDGAYDDLTLFNNTITLFDTFPPDAAVPF